MKASTARSCRSGMARTMRPAVQLAALELDPALLLHARLLDRLHLALQARYPGGARGIALDEEEGRPEQDHADRGRNRVVRGFWSCAPMAAAARAETRAASCCSCWQV